MATKAEMDARFEEMNARFESMDKRLDEMPTKAEMNDRFDRVEKELKELDKDMTGHMAVHRELEEDIELLRRRPPRTAARAARRR